MFRIGDFSRLSRVSIKMLRHYDQLGLLKPAHVDPATGYRYYLADQLPRLHRLIALKDLGFSLEQIALLLHEDLSGAFLRGMLEQRRSEIAEQMRLQEARLTAIESRLNAIEAATPGGQYDVVLRRIEPQLIGSIRDTIEHPDLVTPLFDELERYVARQGGRAASPPLLISHDNGYREQDLDLEVAVPLLKTIKHNQRVNVYQLAGVEQMACVIHTGSYVTINQALSALLHWVAHNGFMLAGPWREVYLRFGADHNLALPPSYLTPDPAGYVTELQVPVQTR